MVKTVSAIKVRQNLGQVLNEAFYQGDEFIVERAGKPVAAIVPIEEFQMIERSRKQFFKDVRAVQERNAKYSASSIERDITKAVAEVRATKKR